MKFKTKRSTLVGRQERLLKNPPATQKKAHRIIAKIATKIFGYKVEKERILRPYIIDSYIKDLKVGIEIDGGIHNNTENYDERRDQFLWEKYKAKIYRFKNDMVGHDYFRLAVWEICLDGLCAYLKKINAAAAGNGAIEKILRHKMQENNHGAGEK